MSIQINEIRKELIGYIKRNPKILQTALLSDEILLNKYSKTVTKVRGEYTSIHSLLGHVVQSFDAKKFTPYGDIQFRKKLMRNYHQKVDFLLTPAEIIGAAIESMYDEDKSLVDKSISKHSIDLLLKKIISDVNILSISGTYNPSAVGAAVPVFGTSMNGINTTLKQIVSDSENPCFMIPSDAITDNNIVDVVTKYEQGLPILAKPLVHRVFISLNDKERYQIAYEDKFGQNQFQTNVLRTRLGKREIVGLPGLTDGTIFSCVDNNLVKLVDLIDNPATITDVQVQDRTLKILTEFTLGYDFAVNELTFVHSENANVNRGLNNATLNKLYYPEEKLTVVKKP